MLVQSGKPVGVFRTHEWAPRVLIANSNLVPEWATWDEFRRLEALGLTMYGQMTAGSWIYIGTQGILQGTYECFAEIARRSFGGTLAGTITLTAGLGGMGGAQPLAVTMNGGVALCIDVDPERIAPPARDPLPRRGRRLAGRRRRPVRRGPRRPPGRCRSACVGNAADARAPPARARLPRRHRHRPDQRPRPAELRAGRPDARGHRRAGPHRSRRARPPGPGSRWPRTARRWSASSTGAAEVFDYGNSLRTEARLGGFDRAFDYPGFLPAYIRPLFCEGKGPFRWVALSGDPADIAATDRAVLEEFPDDEGLRPLDPAWPASGWRSRACRPASAGSATASATGSGCGSTRWCGAGEVSAPIVIGRDHLDSRFGGLAVPRDRGDGRRLRRHRRLAAAQRPGQHGQRGDVGEHPPRRRRRHRPLDPRRHGVRRRRHRSGGRRSSSGCSPPTRGWA